MGTWFSYMLGLHDHDRILYEDGQIERHERYRNGKRTEGKYWYKNGQLYEHTFYNGNELKGNSKHWHQKNGAILMNAFYHEGELEGKYMLWHDNLHPKMMAFCRSSNIEGEAKRWSPDGRLENHSYWKNGRQSDGNFGNKRKIFLMLKRWLYLRIHSYDLDAFLIADLTTI